MKRKIISIISIKSHIDSTGERGGDPGLREEGSPCHDPVSIRRWKELMTRETYEKYTPVPVKAILDTIAGVLVSGIGQEFTLEIRERPHRNNPDYNAVTIELEFRVPAPKE